MPPLEYVLDTYDIDADPDCVLYMADVEQTWGRSWLSEPEGGPGAQAGTASPVAGD